MSTKDDDDDLARLRADRPSSRVLVMATATCVLVAIALGVGYVAYDDHARRARAVAFETADPVDADARSVLASRAAAVRTAIAADDDAIRAFLFAHPVETLGTGPCPVALTDAYHLVVVSPLSDLSEHHAIGYLPEGYYGTVALTDADEVLARPVLGRGRYDVALQALEHYEPTDVVVVLADAQADGRGLSETSFEAGFVRGHAVWFRASRTSPERRALCHAAIAVESSDGIVRAPGESFETRLAEDLRERLYQATSSAAYLAVE